MVGYCGFDWLLCLFSCWIVYACLGCSCSVFGVCYVRLFVWWFVALRVCLLLVVAGYYIVDLVC